ncbi:hypothetical protein FLAVO9R_200002 [Flavobacterium sp. 9R]|nr:hypothetical protein FLAVO9R_200002 [Flavobacterium sp. 9R]
MRNRKKKGIRFFANRRVNKKTTANTRYKQAGHLARFENSLYLKHLFLTERFRIFNPSLRVARERWQ